MASYICNVLNSSSENKCFQKGTDNFVFVILAFFIILKLHLISGDTLISELYDKIYSKSLWCSKECQDS